MQNLDQLVCTGLTRYIDLNSDPDLSSLWFVCTHKFSDSFATQTRKTEINFNQKHNKILFDAKSNLGKQ